MKNSTNINSGGLLILVAVGLVALTVLTALGKPAPDVLSMVIASALAGMLGLSVPGIVHKAPPVADGQADTTGPADDVAHEVVTEVISGVLGPVGAAAPKLASNIADELARVLKRGIKL